MAMKKPNAFMRAILIVAGLLFVGLGALGVILPGLPTTPFLILAVICFANGHQGLHDWLRRSKFFAPAMRQVDILLTRRAVTLKVKIISQFFAWTSFFLIFVANNYQWDALTISVLVAVILSSVAMICLKTLKD